MRLVYLSMSAGLVTASLWLAPTAAAECELVSGVTVCAQGETTLSEGAGGTGPFVPYPCDYDWLCDDDDLSIVFGGSDNDRPDNDTGLRPDNSLPDQPNRPDRPDRPSRP